MESLTYVSTKIWKIIRFLQFTVLYQVELGKNYSIRMRKACPIQICRSFLGLLTYCHIWEKCIPLE